MNRLRRSGEDPLDPIAVAELEDLERALAGEPAADPVLASFVREVRSDAPTLDEAFRTSLDERVGAGFPGVSGKGGVGGSWAARLLPSGALFRPAIAVAATTLLGIAVTTAILTSEDQPVGNFAVGSVEEDRGAGGAPAATPGASVPQAAEAAPQALQSDDGDTSAKSLAPSVTGRSLPVVPPSAAPSQPSDSLAGGTGGAVPGQLGGVRRVERSAALTLSTAPDDVQSVADDVVRAVQGLGGVVASSRVATVDGGGEAFFDLRLPTSRLDRAIAQLSKLAHVSALTQDSDDITGAFVSAADRLKDARDERAALLRALGRATTDRQIASLRARIADSRRRIAAGEAEVRRLRARTDRATVALTIRGDGEGRGDPGEDEGGAWTPGDAVGDALRVLELAAGVAVVAAALAVPLALLALLAAALARVARRRGRERALDAT